VKPYSSRWLTHCQKRNGDSVSPPDARGSDVRDERREEPSSAPPPLLNRISDGSFGSMKSQGELEEWNEH